jgi:hypothetical protein
MNILTNTLLNLIEISIKCQKLIKIISNNLINTFHNAIMIFKKRLNTKPK